MILTDAGPLVALIDADESSHSQCKECLDELTAPMMTTPPAFTEAVYLIGSASGWKGQQHLWAMRSRDVLTIRSLSDHLWTRCETLMKKYRDQPMDLADSSLVVLSEELNTSRIFTLDSDFRQYRKKSGESFTIIP